MSYFVFSLWPLQWQIQTKIRTEGHPDPEIKGGSLPKKYFRPFGPQFGLKIRGAQVPRVPPLDPPVLYSKMAIVFLQIATAVPGEHAVLDYTKSDGKLPMMILCK